MKIERTIVPDITLREEISHAAGEAELIALARRAYLSFDHRALMLCIDRYVGLYGEDGMKEYRWLMETSCW